MNSHRLDPLAKPKWIATACSGKMAGQRFGIVRNVTLLHSPLWTIRGIRPSIRRSVTAGAGAFASGAGLCDRVGTFRLADTAGVYGRTHTVSQIVARLRCQQCGRSPVDVQLISTDDRGVTEAIRIA